MPPKKHEPPKTIVKAVEAMIQLELRQHVLKRHIHMRFVTRAEHVADHRMRGDLLDHTHEEYVPPAEPVQEEPGEGEVNAEDQDS